MADSREAVTSRRYEVWCQGHIDYCEEKRLEAHPRYVERSWNEAQKRLGEANRECQAGADHFIKKVDA